MWGKERGYNMRIFRYLFDGEALGGEMVIVANSIPQADKLAEEKLKKRYPKIKDPAKTHNLTFDDNSGKLLNPEGDVVYFWDGDY
jgi:hypothetical protein